MRPVPRHARGTGLLSLTTNRLRHLPGKEMTMPHSESFNIWLDELRDKRSKYIYVGLRFGSALVRLACITACAGVAFLLTFSAVNAGLTAAQAGWPRADVVQFGGLVLASLLACALMAKKCPRAAKRAQWRIYQGRGVLTEWRGHSVTEEARATWHGEIFDDQVGIVIEILGEAIRDLCAPNMELSFAGLLTRMTTISRELDPSDERAVEVLVNYLSPLVDDPAGELFIHAILHGIFRVDLFEGVKAQKQQKIWDRIVKANRNIPER
jgi:hypothetical protein